MRYDCVIIGGGPAGLTAAIYLARYRRAVLVCDAGNSRALSIPKSHNYPGFADGICGAELLKLLRDQLGQYAVEHRVARVQALVQDEHGFIVKSAAFADVTTQFILLATGLSDKAPEIVGLDKASISPAVRYCPVCDAYEAMDKNVAVLGPVEDVATKARFLRTYSRSVTILPDRDNRRATHIDVLDNSGIHIAATPREIRAAGEGIDVLFDNGARQHFDILYPALGCEVHSELARALGARCNPVGCVEVDDKQRTSVNRLYAAGDVVSDLHQLTVAAGHAAIAATAIHNQLPRNFR